MDRQRQTDREGAVLTPPFLPLPEGGLGDELREERETRDRDRERERGHGRERGVYRVLVRF
jgi:hypothetical protein